MKYFPSRGTPPRSHLVCPTPNTENPVTWSGLREVGIDATPDRIICQDPFNFNAWRAYALANGPGQSRSLQSDRLAIGNATDLTAWMIANAHDTTSVPERDAVLFAHWNLDADRGYGYRAWSGNVPHAEPYDVAGETSPSSDRPDAEPWDASCAPVRRDTPGADAGLPPPRTSSQGASR